MPDQRASENWRLEEGGKEDDKWLLQESEQQLSDQWQLQEPGMAEPINSWQPVEYVKSPRPAGTWILPTIITVALLVTLGYAGYRVLPALLNGDPEATPTEEVAASVPGVGTSEAPAQETPPEQLTPAPEATAIQETPPTPTSPAPEATTPPSLVTQ